MADKPAESGHHSKPAEQPAAPQSAEPKKDEVKKDSFFSDNKFTLIGLGIAGLFAIGGAGVLSLLVLAAAFFLGGANDKNGFLQNKFDGIFKDKAPQKELSTQTQLEPQQHTENEKPIDNKINKSGNDLPKVIIQEATSVQQPRKPTGSIIDVRNNPVFIVDADGNKMDGGVAGSIMIRINSNNGNVLTVSVADKDAKFPKDTVIANEGIKFKLSQDGKIDTSDESNKAAFAQIRNTIRYKINKSSIDLQQYDVSVIEGGFTPKSLFAANDKIYGQPVDRSI